MSNSEPLNPALADLKEVAVVLDTNVLDQTSLLSDPLSVAMLFYLRHLEGQLVLPEVIKTEWSEHWHQHFRAKAKALADARDWLDRHVEIPPLPLEVDDLAESSFAHRLLELGDLLVLEPIAKTDWQEAGQMVLEKRPPSKTGSQQYKDSLLWRSLLRVGQDQTVILVTADAGFQGPGGEGLEPSLATEAEQLDANILLVKGRKQLLDLLKDQSEDFVEDHEGIWEEVETAFVDEVNDILLHHGWQAGDWGGEWSNEAFAAGDPSKLVLAMTFEGQLTEIAEPEVETSMYVEAEGSALVKLDTLDIHIDLDLVTLRAETPHGTFDQELLRSSPKKRAILSRLDLSI